MSNNKQSSVEWLYNKMYEHRGNITIEEFEQAKAMHKEEIKMTAIKCHFEGTRQISKTSEEYIQYGEQYYNETFGGEK
jgi:hypothetical protein